MKIAIVTDQHFGVRNGSSIFLDHQRKFYDDIFFPTIEHRGITTVFDLGDTFDVRKNINFVALKESKCMWFDKLKDRNITLHSLVGNHTAVYKNTNDVNSVDLLTDQYSNVVPYSEPKEINVGGLDILMMPWINNENYGHSMECMNSTKAQVLFGHFEIAGCLMDKNVMNEHGMKISDFRKFDMVLSGHFHHKSITNNIHYLGSPYQMTWADYGDQKGFHIFDTDTRELEFIKNPFEMFHKIWYDDEGKSIDELLNFCSDEYRNSYVKIIKQTVNNLYYFDLFCDKIYKSDPANVQIVDDHLNLGMVNDSDIVSEAEDTLTILSKYIDQMGSDIPKQELSKLMRSLYMEALQMEV